MNIRELLRHHSGKVVLLGLLVALVGAAPFLQMHGRSDEPEATTLYHCPMHPSYASDRPGDCPICGMQLVPVADSSSGAPGSGPAAQDLYVCPMHPQVQQHEPGKCPICGMDLVRETPKGGGRAETGPPRGPGAIEGLVPIRATTDQMSLAGVRTMAASTGELGSSIRAVGNVMADETRVRQVTTKVAGWVEHLYVNNVGQQVRAGDPLLDLYSPELLASQEEYLRALKTAAEFDRSALPEVRQGGRDLALASKRRLELFDVPDELLGRLERDGAAQRTITLRAPFSGHVTAKTVLEGQRIDAGTPLVTITDLSQVWVVAQLYEAEARHARPGRSAEVSPQYDAATRLSGRVSLVYPTIDMQSRTIQIRFEFANPRLALRPGMFVNVELSGDRARGVIVPESAVMDTGTRQVVFVETAPGHFDPREVRPGLRSGGQVLIGEGLREGERVAVSANFLLDSESRLRAAIGERR